jgi:predicted phosphodiesterase
MAERAGHQVIDASGQEIRDAYGVAGRHDEAFAQALEHESVEVEALRSRLIDAERKLLSQGDVNKRLKESRAEMARMEKEMRLLSTVGSTNPPGWLKDGGKRKAGVHYGTPWLMLSDLHLDEVVFPDQVMGINAYDRAIAHLRLDTTTANFVDVWKHYHQGVTYDGAVVCLGGDIFSGDIHEELKETNEDTLFGSIEYWVDPLASTLSYIADAFGKVHVPVVVGNHGRTTRKPRAKFRARSNADWKIGCDLQRIFAKDDRITFDVSDSADCVIDSYGRRIMLTHGDQASGGSGWGGIFSPIGRLDDKKSKRQQAVDKPYDLMVLGHWHQLIYGPDWIVNGSMKGYDEYAFTSNFGYEVPSQASWLMTPEHGKTETAPIFSQDRALEGW